MFRSKSFYMKTVYDTKGKKLGSVEDIYIDFFNGKMKGIKLSKYSILSKKSYVKIEDIISIGKDIIVTEVIEEKGLLLKDIKGMDVIDLNNVIKGVVEDIIIGEKDYLIKGIIVSTGVIEKFLRGKDIVLTSECILGEKFILYTGDDKIRLKAMPKRMIDYEESI